jgi:hypothetical protein
LLIAFDRPPGELLLRLFAALPPGIRCSFIPSSAAYVAAEAAAANAGGLAPLINSHNVKAISPKTALVLLHQTVTPWLCLAHTGHYDTHETVLAVQPVI